MKALIEFVCIAAMIASTFVIAATAWDELRAMHGRDTIPWLEARP